MSRCVASSRVDSNASHPPHLASIDLRDNSPRPSKITHIQFLTLLYPSALEARLIFGLLGPIALASAAMTFTGLSSGKTVQYGLILRNICNSTLSLLFTSALFLWGFYVNRRRAWRTDGGTAAFGAGALVLAVSSTAVNFLEVKVDRLSWLQHLLWSIILWQSWLGWWWWVGSGMGIGEVEVRAKAWLISLLTHSKTEPHSLSSRT